MMTACAAFAHVLHLTPKIEGSSLRWVMRLTSGHALQLSPAPEFGPHPTQRRKKDREILRAV
jgi:hypothetical protein